MTSVFFLEEGAELRNSEDQHEEDGCDEDELDGDDTTVVALALGVG